jgi:hypothetical protein
MLSKPNMKTMAKNKNLKPFHEMSDSNWQELLESKATWNDIMKEYAQPEWCDYPDALKGMMGCWSLIRRMVTGEDYCKSCDCYKSRNHLTLVSDRV